MLIALFLVVAPGTARVLLAHLDPQSVFFRWRNFLESKKKRKSNALKQLLLITYNADFLIHV
jgi:hypothetical protein